MLSLAEARLETSTGHDDVVIFDIKHLDQVEMKVPLAQSRLEINRRGELLLSLFVFLNNHYFNFLYLYVMHKVMYI